MKGRRFYIRIILFCTGIISLNAGCGKRDVCEFSHPHRGEVHFSFDWQHLFSSATPPQRMALHFYSATGDTLISHILRNEKGRLTLPADTYRVLAYSEDQTSFSVSGLEDMDKAMTEHLFLQDGTVAPGEPFYVCVAESFVVRPDEEIRYTFIPERHSQRMSFQLQVNGLFNPSACWATLSGLSGSVRMAAGVSAEGSSPVTAAFPLDISGNQASGSFYSLGTAAARTKAANNLLTLNFTMASGLQHSVSADITEALTKMINGDIEISLTIDGDEISGLKATVTAWTTGDGATVVIP